MSLLGPRKAGRGRVGASHQPLLIRTKLEPPARAERILPRTRLFEFLSDHPNWKLMAVHAPAGYGKTEFLRALREQLEAKGWGIGWVRLDREDNDPARLLRYIEAALRQAGLIDSPASEPLTLTSGRESVSLTLERLCARISTIDQDSGLIIDHAQELDSKEAWHCLETVIRYLPETLRVCIASRSPEFPGLGRLRGEPGLIEIDAGGLALRVEEVQKFLDDSPALKLDAQAGGQLYRMTQGWPLGLQMLGISLEASEDPKALVSETNGGTGPFPNYFRQEIFDRLTEPQRKLVLLLGIAGTAPVELLSELSDSEILPGELERLIASGMFVSKDPRPGWYRMHCMLAEFTQVEWRERDPDGLVQCHEKAALWFGARGETEAAVRHAILAANDQLALGFINQCLEPCIDQARFAQIAAWRGILPESDLHRYPVLVLMMGWELGSQGRWLDAELLAGGVIQALVRKGRRKRQDTKENEIRRAIGLRACAGLISGKDELLAESAQQWRSSDDGKPGESGIAMAALAQASLQAGDYESMQARLQRASTLQGRHASSLVGALVDWVRSSAALEAGDLERALRLARMSGSLIETAEVRNWTVGLLDVVAARVGFERGEADFPAERLRDLLHSQAALLPAAARAEATTLLAGHVYATQGLPSAREILQTGRELLPDIADATCRIRVDAEEIRLLLRSGKVADAKQTLRNRGWDQLAQARGSGFEPVYAEIAEVTARLSLAEGKYPECLKLLGELQVMTPDWMAYRKARYLALEVAATEAAGKPAEASAMLTTLINESAKVGLIQSFLEAGELMQQAIRAMLNENKVENVAHGIYINRLLTAFDNLAGEAQAGSTKAQQPVETLTEREAQVLEMVAAGCSNSEISKRLYLSLGTVKWHLHNVYDKLMVRNRTQAVNRARELRWM